MSTSLLGVLQHASLNSVAGCPFQEHKFTASYFPLCGSRVGGAWNLLSYLPLGKEIETKKWLDVNLLEFCSFKRNLFGQRGIKPVQMFCEPVLSCRKCKLNFIQLILWHKRSAVKTDKLTRTQCPSKHKVYSKIGH